MFACVVFFSSCFNVVFVWETARVSFSGQSRVLREMNGFIRVRQFLGGLVVPGKLIKLTIKTIRNCTYLIVLMTSAGAREPKSYRK